MNSTKLFNFKYLRENIKKSIGLLSLVSIIAPLFTILIVVFVASGKSTCNVASFIDIALINILGMYTVPFFISLALFGYVFNKKSVDFINSMPLNRKTIFVTNTLGGIIVITLIQLVTALGLLLCSAFCKGIYIFPSMVWDVFIMMWIGYVFVFTATNLAMSFSGTAWTQIAVTLLILFLIPFYIISYNVAYYSSWVTFVENGIEQFETSDYSSSPFNSRTFTLPSNIIYSGLLDSGSWYSQESNVRTIILSIIYFGLGLYMFKRRKMENAEESFSDSRVHLLIKALTMFPMIVLVRLASEVTAFSIIVYALIIVYYFLYDFIVKKKISLKISIPALLLIILVLNGFCEISEKAFETNKEKEKNVDISKIDEIDLSISNSKDFIYYTKNEDIIKLLISGAKNYYNTERSYYIDSTYKYVYVRFREGSNTKCVIGFSLKKEDYENIKSIIENEKSYIENIKNKYTEKGVIAINNNVIRDSKIVEEVNKEIENEVNNMKLLDIFNLGTGNNYYIQKEIYINHRLSIINLPVDMTNRIFEIISEYENDKTKSFLSGNKNNSLSFSYSIRNINLREMEIPEHYYFDYTSKDISEFIKNDTSKFDVNKSYYIIEGHFYNIENHENVYFSYFTNNIDALNEIAKKDYEINKKNMSYDYYDPYNYEVPDVVANIVDEEIKNEI